MTTNVQVKHSHYYKDVSKLRAVDVYRVLHLYGVTDPCIQHAVKKLLVAGGRGAKDQRKDVQEAIDTLNRWIEMRQEDEGPQSHSLEIATAPEPGVVRGGPGHA